MSDAVGSGCVFSHSARAGPVGSIPVFFHHPEFVATAMDLTVMTAAQRDGELVADLSSECTALGQSEVVGI